MAELIVMIGVPGSGKSTFVNSMASQGNVVVCPDSIRGELTGDEADQTVSRKAWDIAYKRVVDNLAQGKNVVLDATNTVRGQRRDLIGYVRSKVPGVVIKAAVKDVPKEVAIQRLKKRVDEGGRYVPADVIEKMHNRLTLNPPTVEEGFNEIINIPDEEIVNEIKAAANKMEKKGMFEEAGELDSIVEDIKKT